MNAYRFLARTAQHAHKALEASNVHALTDLKVIVFPLPNDFLFTLYPHYFASGFSFFCLSSR
jgi:hypothetical protein